MNLRVDYVTDQASFDKCPLTLKKLIGNQLTQRLGDDVKTGKAVIRWSTIYPEVDAADRTRERKLTPDQPGARKLARTVTPDTHLETIQQVAFKTIEAQLGETTYSLSQEQAKTCLLTLDHWDEEKAKLRLTRLLDKLEECPAFGEKVISFTFGQPYVKGTSYPHDCDANLKNIVKGDWSLDQLDEIVQWVARAIVKAQAMQVEVVDIFLKGDVGKMDPITGSRKEMRGSYLIIRLADKSQQDKLCDLEFLIGDYSDSGVEKFDTDTISTAFNEISKAGLTIDRSQFIYAKDLNIGSYSVTIKRGLT